MKRGVVVAVFVATVIAGSIAWFTRQQTVDPTNLMKGVCESTKGKVICYGTEYVPLATTEVLDFRASFSQKSSVVLQLRYRVGEFGQVVERQEVRTYRGVLAATDMDRRLGRTDSGVYNVKSLKTVTLAAFGSTPSLEHPKAVTFHELATANLQ